MTAAPRADDAEALAAQTLNTIRHYLGVVPIAKLEQILADAIRAAELAARTQALADAVAVCREHISARRYGVVPSHTAEELADAISALAAAGTEGSAL